MLAIEASDLTKIFRVTHKEPGLRGSIKSLFKPDVQEKVAVDGATFQVEAGEMVGYIGVNGAGKSTTIKMLTGILLPSRGQARVLGLDPHRERVANARQIGVVFGQRSQLWWDLALGESLAMVGKIYEVDPQRYQQLLKQFSETLELGELMKTPVRSLSLGQKMRAELAATLIHEPRVVYLDEPTIGLDLIVKERIREFILEQNRSKGITVLLTTHDLGDIEQLCQRVIIIDHGKVIYDGPITTIKARFGKFRTISFETRLPVEPDQVQLPAGAERVSNGAEAEEGKLVLRFDRTVTTASQVASSLMNQLDVVDFSLAEPDLSSIIKQIYNGALADADMERPIGNAELLSGSIPSETAESR